jgi:hypothetical protein
MEFIFIYVIEKIKNKKAIPYTLVLLQVIVIKLKYYLQKHVDYCYYAREEE